MERNTAPIWRDWTLYTLLTRKEYLGHTVTAKEQTLSYKIKKRRDNPPEKQHIFLNTHEPLIDEATFELAQKRYETRNRPAKMDEIDIFSGLLYCADCGARMQQHRGADLPESKYAYTCGSYRSRVRVDHPCTTHYIRRIVLKELVLADLRRVLSYVKGYEGEFVRKAAECSDREAKKAVESKRRELSKSNARMNELDTLFRKLYEDNALGRLSDQQFVMLTSGYEDEKKTLIPKIAMLEQEISAVVKRGADAGKFVKIVRQYTDIQELTYENLHQFIDRILIHGVDPESSNPCICRKSCAKRLSMGKIMITLRKLAYTLFGNQYEKAVRKHLTLRR